VITRTDDPDAEVARRFRRRLHGWFRRNGRDLPWRRTRDPYRVLVSELMLQQTQVSRVLEYYDRFLRRFPTMKTLAGSSPRRVRESWEGLGYYARVRNLHALARQVTREGTPLPAEPAELRMLPGIGPYTAGAVASFAYERRAALVDTNVARVLRRVFALRVDPHRGATAREIWTLAETLLPRTGRSAWTHNQALIELGALICTARAPRCPGCPVRKECASAPFNGERPAVDRGGRKPRKRSAGKSRPQTDDRSARRRGQLPAQQNPTARRHLPE
jgi:A/G-specific adenine glycosylase